MQRIVSYPLLKIASEGSAGFLWEELSHDESKAKRAVSYLFIKLVPVRQLKILRILYNCTTSQI